MIILQICIVITFSINASAYEFPGGYGTPGDPYQIADANDLIAIGQDLFLLERDYVLLNDIFLDPNGAYGTSIIPGYYTGGGGGRGGGGGGSFHGFSGSIDGRCHVIGNLPVPLINLIGPYGEVLNLGLTDVHIDVTNSPEETVGALAVRNQGTIRDCYVRGELATYGTAGGLVGINEGSNEITDCYASVSISHAEIAGGLVGVMYGGSIIRCYGVGRFLEDQNETFLPLVSGPGLSDDTLAVNSYFLFEGTSASLLGTPLTESQMKTQDSFESWDFFGRNDDGIQDRWFMPEDGYPLLIWQAETGLVRIPDLSGTPTDQVEGLLNAMGLSLGNIESHYDPSFAAGTVVATIPRIYAPAGSAVSILSSLGPYDWANNPGDGSATNPYEVSTVGQLLCMGPDLTFFDWEYFGGTFYRLTNNLDMSARVFTAAPVGTFMDILDGGGHTISNLTIIADGNDVGLFSRIGQEALVSHLILQNAYVHVLNSENVGGLAGINEGFLQDCHISGTVVGCVSVGGLVGDNAGLISMCHSEGSVKGQPPGFGLPNVQWVDWWGPWVTPFIAEGIGGLVGLCREGIVSSCYSTTEVIGEYQSNNLGGLIGQLGKKGPVNPWGVPTSVDVGVVFNCYATGAVVVDTSSWEEVWPPISINIGGLIGHLSAGYIANCYTLATNLAGDNSHGISSYYRGFSSDMMPWWLQEPAARAVGLTDEQLKSQQSFFGWDFENIWTIREGEDYPRLWWENREYPEQ